MNNQVQTAEEKGEAEAIFKALDRFRRLNGERYANHLLRNLLQQSNTQLRDMGVIVADDQRVADLEIQVRKSDAEANAAKAYANHFGLVLRSISTTAKDEHTANKAKRALEWTPDEETVAQDEKAIAAARATH